ncbi:MAG: hypothetical protein QM702_00095 [Rubrivivax sp.]
MSWHDQTLGGGLQGFIGALGFERHFHCRYAGKWRIYFAAGLEQWMLLGAPADVVAVVDDFGNLVGVPA